MIILILSILSLISTCLYLYFTQYVNDGIIWWSIPIVYIIFWIIFLILFVFMISFYSIFLNIRKKVVKPNKTLNRINYLVAKLIQSFYNIDVVFENEELIPKDSNFFLVHNHQSNLDPILIVGTFKNHLITYIMKNNIMRAPVIGRWLKAAGFLPLDRKNDRKALEVVSQAVKRLQAGYIMGAAPEGTRSKGPEMNEFRPGVFKIPQKAGVPILVVMVDGFYKRNTRMPIVQGRVLIRVCELIPNDEFRDVHTNAISDRVFKSLNDNLLDARNNYDWLK